MGIFTRRAIVRKRDMIVEHWQLGELCYQFWQCVTGTCVCVQLLFIWKVFSQTIIFLFFFAVDQVELSPLRSGNKIASETGIEEVKKNCSSWASLKLGFKTKLASSLEAPGAFFQTRDCTDVYASAAPPVVSCSQDMWTPSHWGLKLGPKTKVAFNL